MKTIKKFITIVVMTSLVLGLTACADFTGKAKNSIDAYMKNLMGLTTENYVTWVNENLENPYADYGLDLSQLKENNISYFTNCLTKIKYEVTNVDEANKTAEVKVTYIDSTDYISELIVRLLSFAFSEEYTEEGENQIYLDVMNEIEEDKYVDDTLYFGLNDDASIATVSNNAFDIATAGMYKLMLGDPSELENSGSKYSEEELLANLVVDYEIIDENSILVTITNNNDVPVYPYVDLIFSDKDGNYVIQSQANIQALPAGATNYSSAYNELSDDVVSVETEVHVEYYNPEDIVFFDESLIPCEISQVDDEVDLVFTNNTDETIGICGAYIVYGMDGSVIYVGDIYCSDLNPGETDKSWFYVNSTYDEKTDTWTPDPYDHIEVYPIAHTQASSIWCNQEVVYVIKERIK